MHESDIAARKEAVILVHGLWMPGLVMLVHRRWLEGRGFAPLIFSYPSWSAGLDPNADRLAAFIAAIDAPVIHLVGHSLGGLLALLLLERPGGIRIRRIVLMGTPCTGCHCGRYLAVRPLLAPLLGRSIRDWLGRPPPQPPATAEIGVITGTRRFGLGCVIPGLPQPNDGVVALAETCLPAAQDSIALPVCHSGMLLSAACAEQAAAFFRRGRFIHA